MSDKIMYRTRFGLDADKRIINVDDLSTEVLREGNEITVYSRQCPADKIIGHGYGPKNGEFAEAYINGDLVASGNGTGVAGDDVDAEIVIAVTDSTQEDVLARRVVTDTGDLREMTAEVRSDRLVESETTGRASEDKHIEIRLKARSASDGVELDTDPANSSFKFYTHEANAR